VAKKKNSLLNKIEHETRSRFKKTSISKKRPKSTGNIKTVRFGDPNMKIKRSSDSNRKSFMARHGALLDKVKGQKNLSPVYWALRSWKLGTKI
jgi:hypothetical protein